MKDTLPVPISFSQAVNDATGQLSKRSKRIYESDAKALANWMIEQELTPDMLTRSHMIAYRAYLSENYAKATAARMLSVARRILNEQIRDTGRSNPADDIKGFTLKNESSHIALTKQQAKDLLLSIDRSNPRGKRDYVVISLLLRTGIRRTECISLNIGDFTQDQGHIVATIRHGKGDNRRKVKIPVDVFRTIEEYIQSTERAITSLDEPLFIGFGKWKHQRTSDKYIERIVIRYGKKIGIEHLTPHDLRTSFITLAKEGGATLEQRQFAAGHSDPRTTQRYDIRKLNLDDNAVDYIRLGLEDI